jgi:tRNA(Ser,Leu) C12 N-acetylase TAN1
MEEYNGFIVSCPRNFEENAAVEMDYLLSDKLDIDNVEVTPIYELTGLCIAHFSQDPEALLLDLIDLLQEDILFNYILKLVPIRYRFETTLENFEEIGSLYDKKIKTSDKWRITIRRRNSPLERQKILDAAARFIESGIVDLEEPKYYIRLEVNGETSYSSFIEIPELSIKKYERDEEDYIQKIIP